jgi:biotin synthase
MIRDEFRMALDGAIRFGEDAKKAREETSEATGPAPTEDSPVLPTLELLLAATEPEETALLFARAAEIRDAECGRRMVLRGLVEFSSRCSNTCLYCGLNRNNKNAERYRLSNEEILESAALIAKAGIRTMVLQSGEDGFPAEWLASVLRGIKDRHDMAITLSVGERPRADFALWKDAGADRFLMRVESSTPELYASLHLGRTLATRLACLDDLRELGYQVGSGIMVGPPGQTVAHIARDIFFFSARDFDMIGIGPFIPHPDTPFHAAPAGTVGLTLNALALTRIVTRNSWLPATTALGSLDRDYRVDALKAGANVVMPNFSPVSVKKKYEIYPGKRCVGENTGACACCMDHLAESAGLKLDYSRADSLKMPCYT